MRSWLACLSCECDYSGKPKTVVQETADASAPPILVTADDDIAFLPKHGLGIDVGNDDQKSLVIHSSESNSLETDSVTESEIRESSDSSMESSAESVEGLPRRANPRRVDKKHTAKFIQQGIGKFRKRMLTATGPGALEQDRGVFIEEVYDFYDPSSARVRERKMTEDVVHRRRGSVISMQALPLSHAKSSTSLNSAKTRSGGLNHTKSNLATTKEDDEASSHRSGCSSEMISASPKAPKTLVLKKSPTKSNLELVASWGVFVGSVLHRFVLDFSALSAMMIRERRYLEAKPVHMNRQINNSVQEKAGFVVTQAMNLAKRVKREQRDLLDWEWKETQLLSFLFSTQYHDILILFARAVAKMLHNQPTVAVAVAPCHVFGDIHGQLRDLLLLFACFGMPSEDNTTSFVFNGDFVDRGSHQVEVIGVLLALKLWMPNRIWLVRGNHEDREMNKRYGFKQACMSTLGSEFGPVVFERVHQAFDELPLACLIEKKILCVHGGIGDGNWTLDKLRTVKRPLKEVSLSKRTWLGDILWSDPIEDGKSADPEVFGVHESPRGKAGALFAWNVTKTFCARNGLSLVIRSHQSKENSPGFDVMHEHLLIRVFSARDYESHGNDGAILKVEKQSEADKDLFKIRAQVLRSVTKTREEASRRQAQEIEESADDCLGTPRARQQQTPQVSKKVNRKDSAARARRLSTSELLGGLQS